MRSWLRKLHSQNRRSTNGTATTWIQARRAIVFCSDREMDPAKMYLPIAKPIISAADHTKLTGLSAIAAPRWPDLSPELGVGLGLQKPRDTPQRRAISDKNDRALPHYHADVRGDDNGHQLAAAPDQRLRSVARRIDSMALDHSPPKVSLHDRHFF
jgi:hypothetical protein